MWSVESQRLGELCMLVVDELHCIGEANRGASLELVITKLLHARGEGGLQIVGMSATMGGVEVLSTWLQAELFMTNYRPIPLVEYAMVSTRSPQHSATT